MKVLFVSTCLLVLVTVILTFMGRRTKGHKFSRLAVVSGGFGAVFAVLGFLVSAGYITV